MVPILFKCTPSVRKMLMDGLTKPRCCQTVTCGRSLHASVKKLFKAATLSLYCGYGWRCLVMILHNITCSNCKSDHRSSTNAKIASPIASGGQSRSHKSFEPSSSTKCLGDNVRIVSKSILIIFSIVLPQFQAFSRNKLYEDESPQKMTKEGFCTAESVSENGSFAAQRNGQGLKQWGGLEQP